MGQNDDAAEFEAWVEEFALGEGLLEECPSCGALLDATSHATSEELFKRAERLWRSGNADMRARFQSHEELASNLREALSGYPLQCECPGAR